MIRRKRSDSWFPHKRDTPVKTALRRRIKNKAGLVSRKHDCPTLPEEPEGDGLNEPTVKPVLPVGVSVVPVHCTSVSCSRSPAISETSRNRTTPSVPPAKKHPGHQRTAHLTTELSPVLKAREDDDTPDGVISCSVETGSTLNSIDEDDDNRCSSSSTPLSSLPSPEIFRRESSVEAATFLTKNESLSVNLIKNSTLLESSRAENIHMHHPPNLSIIGDATLNLAGKNCEVSQQKNIETRSQMQTDLIKSEPADNPLKRKTPTKLTKKNIILCKKKVWFKSPVTTKAFKAQHNTPSYSTTQNTNESSSRTKLDPDASKMSEITSKSETLPLSVTLKRPVRTSSATFFDFGSETERDAFFQKMRNRSTKLRSFVFPSRLDTQHPLSFDC